MATALRVRTRWVRWLTAPAVVALLAAGCGDDGDNSEDGATATTAPTAETRLGELADSGVFVGGVAMTTTLVGIHFDREGDEVTRMRILVTDGEPDGDIEWFDGAPDGDRFELTSVDGDATIEGTIEEIEADGTVTFPDGTERVFFTRPAGHGAGIFEMTVSEDGAYTGTSFDGSTIEAQQEGAQVVGSIEGADGERFEFVHNDLSRRLGYSVTGGQPDTYLTIVTRRATELAGRGGAEEIMSGGEATENLISMDIPLSEFPAPGIYYGRVAFQTDKLAIEQFDDNGVPSIRMYVSDSEPEPEGDIEWFRGPLDGDRFSLTSATGTATVDGTVADDGISGTIALPSVGPAAFFAAPAGDGAGIYDVEVSDDLRYTGTSTDGNVLDLTQDGELVMGSITTPDGHVFDLLGADLTVAYQYEVPGSQPDTYVAFAAPNGRFLFGRSGSVREGRPSTNIIGLDKKC